MVSTFGSVVGVLSLAVAQGELIGWGNVFSGSLSNSRRVNDIACSSLTTVLAMEGKSSWVIHPIMEGALNFDGSQGIKDFLVSADNLERMILDKSGTATHQEFSKFSSVEGVRSIHTEGVNFIALKTDGTIKVFGLDADAVTAGLKLTSPAENVFSFPSGFVVVQTDGTIVTWGTGTETFSDVDLSGVVDIVHASDGAFAAVKKNGSVVTWGVPQSGGESSTVNLSSGVKKVVSTSSAFAALKEDGSVVTWGLASAGGDSSTVDLTSGVKAVFSTSKAFAALKGDGSVVTWGDKERGGDSTGTNLSSGIEAIFANEYTFAALKNDGSLVTWGSFAETIVEANSEAKPVKVCASKLGFNVLQSDGSFITDFIQSIPSELQSEELVSVTSTVKETDDIAFAGLKVDGSVVTWGSKTIGGDSSSVDLSSGVVKIVAAQQAFAALKSDGSVVGWGLTSLIDSDVDVSSNVVDLVANDQAFAALMNDKSVQTWGYGPHGGDSSSVDLSSNVTLVIPAALGFWALKEDGSLVSWGLDVQGDSSTVDLSLGVKTVVSNGRAFAALMEDGSVVTWGDAERGGDSNSVNLAAGVKTVVPNSYAFAALKEDGSVVSWGSVSNSSNVDLSSGVEKITSSDAAFAALKTDGSVVTWGSSSYGGDRFGVDVSSDVVDVVGSENAFAALKTDGSVVTWGGDQQDSSLSLLYRFKASKLFAGWGAFVAVGDLLPEPSTGAPTSAPTTLFNTPSSSSTLSFVHLGVVALLAFLYC